MKLELGDIMASLTYTASFFDDWPPDSLGGGVITLRQATRMTYTSDQGYTVTLRGTGLTYDDDGLPSGGIVTGFVIVLNGVTLANLTGATVDFGRAGMQLFGFTRDNGRIEDPDPYSFIQSALRGDDLVTGSDSDDDLRGGIGNDSINAGFGDDYIGAEAGHDTMDGGDGFDTLSYDEANWRWDSFQGVNLDAATGIAIDCFGFTDTFSNFERYRDTLFADTLKGADVDYEQFAVTRGNDLVNGRGGWDVLDYSRADRWGAQHGVNVNLATGVGRDSWNGTDTISNIEEVRGTIFNDTLTGSARDEEFQGRAGIDVINGAGGFDHLAFWDSGENGLGRGIVINTTLAANVQNDGYGNVETALGIESYGGTRFGDRFTGGNETNHFDGDDGNDTLNGGGGEDFLNGGWGNDGLVGGSGDDHMGGGQDNDTLTGNTGNDDFNFGGPLNQQGIDTITDMQVGLDEIWVDSEWGDLTAEFLVANQFRGGAGATTATTANHRVIYNSTTGDLYYDVDGAGGAAAVRFAVLSNRAAINFDDFHVFL